MLIRMIYLPRPQAPVRRGQTGSTGRRWKDAKRGAGGCSVPIPQRHVHHHITRRATGEEADDLLPFASASILEA